METNIDHKLIKKLQFTHAMVNGANRSGARKRVQVRIPSGKSVLKFREKRPGKPSCPSGRELPGTARGTKAQIRKLTKTQRRPSRPYGGVLSSPVMREVMRERAQEHYTQPQGNAEKLYGVGAVCMKIAGRDAGKLCVITETLEGNFVKVDGYTRPRKVSMRHIEPTGRTVDVKKATDSKAIQALLSEQ